MNNNDLTTILKSVSAKYGYEEASARFIPIEGFKLRWERTLRSIDMEVSDYLADAPEEVIESVLTTTFNRSISYTGDRDYQPALVDYITSDGFVKAKQPVYLSRVNGISNHPMGKKDLAESYRRLIESGLVEEDPLVAMGWAVFPNSTTVGRTSVIMKAIQISELLDRDDVDDELLDYCLYSQLVRVRMGFNAGTGSRMTAYKELLDLFPDRPEMERKLELRGMRIFGRGESS